MLAVLACKDASPPAKEAPPAPRAPADAAIAEDGRQCPPQPFAESTPLPEASGAAWLEIDGKLALVVVADSGHDGAYALIDPDTGETREQGKLPLGKLDDDLEGLASRDGRLYGLTSTGLLRVWRRNGAAFDLVDGPYAIGTAADGTACPGAVHRCRIDYEGLALAPNPRGPCAGFACSRGDGHLYCLVEKDGRFSVDPARRIRVTRPGVLADCAFSDTGTLWVGNNTFGLNEIFRIDGWAEPETAKVVSTNAFGIGFPEVIAARGDVMYRMSDTGGSPSLMAKYRCRKAPARP